MHYDRHLHGFDMDAPLQVHNPGALCTSTFGGEPPVGLGDLLEIFWLSGTEGDDEVVAESVIRVYENHDSIRGLAFTYEPESLRFFQATFERI